jgi:hypothetical protein
VHVLDQLSLRVIVIEREEDSLDRFRLVHEPKDLFLFGSQDDGRIMTHSYTSEEGLLISYYLINKNKNYHQNEPT